MTATTTETLTETPAATDTSEPDAVKINALLAELRVARNAVDSKQWLSADLAGEPVVSIGALGSTTRPLSALDSAGMGFLTPMVSFLEEPLDQLRGNPDSVSSGASEFDGAARDATSVAEEYRSSMGSETSQWSGEAASGYGQSGTELIDGILTLAETSLTASKSLIGAGEVVAQVVDTVTRLIGEAVAKITPIMSEAIAAAPATFGQSIAAAIPQCVQIAVDYAGQIAGKLAALLSSGENLIKLVDGALGVLQIAKGVMKFIGDQSQGGSSGGQNKPSERQQPSESDPEPSTAEEGQS